MTRRRLAPAAVAAAIVLGVLAPPRVAVADGEQGEEASVGVTPCSATVDPGTPPVVNDQPSVPLEQMDIAEANEIATGRGVGVAVVDAAVVPGVPIPVDGGTVIRGGEVTVDHGTVVAGLIAGGPREVAGSSLAVGIAPDARIIPVRVVGPIDPEQSGMVDDFRPEDIVAGLNWVADQAGPAGIDIVNLSFNTDGALPGVEAAIERIQEQDVIVVAATANRGEEDLEQYGEASPVPEVRVWPAAYDGVVGVTTYVPFRDENGEPVDPESLIKASPDIDVAAPTEGAVSYGPNGSSCQVDLPAASWASAYVSGVLALLKQEFPEEDPEELVARLRDTASGSPDQLSTISGAGVVQPVEALTREVDTDRRGRLQVPEQADDSDGSRAEPPPVRTDELAESRDDFRWWGLLAGAVLVGAVILRPLLRRIRRS